jgi:hypothetical protein
MSDLYSLIRQSIIDRGLATGAERQDVYDQARTAVRRELWSYEPQLDDDEIEARMGAFDRAIDALEEELVAVFADTPAREAGRRVGSVFEGYDRDSDYVPAYIDRAPAAPAGGPRRPGRREMPRLPPPPPPPEARPQRLDPLALRSAAIEAALRATGEDGETAFEAEVPGDAGDDSGMTAGLGRARGFAELAEAEDGDETGDRPRAGLAEETLRGGEDDDGGEAPARHDLGDDEAPSPVRAARPRRPPRRRLDERTRIRILIGAIAAMAIVLVALAGFILTSVLSRSSGPVAAGAVSAAAEGGSGAAADAQQTFTVFDGGDPTVFDSGPGNPVQFDKGSGFARITSSTSDPGVRVTIGQGLASRFAGRSVRVTVAARTARENGAAGLRFAYENGIAISPWQKASLGNDFVSYSLVWRVPALRVDPGTDQLLIEPGIPGDGTAAEIQSIKISVLKQNSE